MIFDRVRATSAFREREDEVKSPVDRLERGGGRGPAQKFLAAVKPE